MSIRFAGGGADLKVWTVARPGPRALLYFGGNAEDVAFNLTGIYAGFPGAFAVPGQLSRLRRQRRQPSEAGLVADAIALVRPPAPRYPEISVIGRSLGSGVAVQLASARDVCSGWRW